MGDAPNWWRRQAATWGWKERAEAYDAELRRLDGLEWEKHREEIREISWNLAKRLWDKANAMLAFPVSEQQVQQDGQTVIIAPARWTFRDVAVIAETADRLARLAAGLPTKLTESKVEGEVAVAHEDGGQSPWDLLDAALLDAIIGQVERADMPPEDTGDDDDDWSGADEVGGFSPHGENERRLQPEEPAELPAWQEVAPDHRTHASVCRKCGES